MTSKHSLRCYDYVNQPFDRVAAALRSDAEGVFKRATASASEREHAIAVQLRVRVGSLEVATDVRVEVGPTEEKVSAPEGYQMTVFPLTWRSISSPSLFPHMHARLLIYPLSSSETQLEFDGAYDPPLGLFGDAIDALVGKRIAEATVLRFVQDVAALLRRQLAKS
jgi:hypothetical protein